MGASSGEATSRTAIPRHHGKGETHRGVKCFQCVCIMLSYLNCEHDIARTYAGFIYVEPESLKAFIYYVLCGHLCGAPRLGLAPLSVPPLCRVRRGRAGGGGAPRTLANVNKYCTLYTDLNCKI